MTPLQVAMFVLYATTITASNNQFPEVEQKRGGDPIVKHLVLHSNLVIQMKIDAPKMVAGLLLDQLCGSAGEKRIQFRFARQMIECDPQTRHHLQLFPSLALTPEPNE